MIYFISQEDNKFIKIGYIKHISNLDNRVIGIQTGNPYKLRVLGCVPGNRDTERRYHAEYSPYRVQGEWFSGDIINAVTAQIEAWEGVDKFMVIHAELMDVVHQYNPENDEKAKDIHWS